METPANYYNREQLKQQLMINNYYCTEYKLTRLQYVTKYRKNHLRYKNFDEVVCYRQMNSENYDQIVRMYTSMAPLEYYFSSSIYKQQQKQQNDDDV